MRPRRLHSAMRSRPSGLRPFRRRPTGFATPSAAEPWCSWAPAASRAPTARARALQLRGRHRGERRQARLSHARLARALHRAHAAQDARKQRQALAQRRPAVQLCRNERNLGYAGAVNGVLDRCRGRYVAVCNMDLRAEPGWLASLVEHLERHPGNTELEARIRSYELADRMQTSAPEAFVSAASFAARSWVSAASSWAASKSRLLHQSV